jgi:hypothetical protein
MAKEEQKQYNDKVKSKFSESLYQHMASRRFGIDFCCDTAKKLWEMKNDLLNLNNISDAAECRTICPEEASNCSFSCVDINYCNLNFYEYLCVFINGDNFLDHYDEVYSYETTNPELFQDLLDMHDCWITGQNSGFEKLCAVVAPNCHYTHSCYYNINEFYQLVVSLIEDALTCIENEYAEYNVEVAQEEKFLKSCEDEQQTILNELEQLNDELGELNGVLAALQSALANETDPNIIAKLQAEIDSVNADIDSVNANIADVEEDLASAESNCGGNLAYIETRIETINQNQEIYQDLANRILEDLNTIKQQMQVLIQTLEEILSGGEEDIPSCAILVPFVAASYINYTACSGEAATSILGENARIYNTLNSSFTYTSTTFYGTEAHYEQLAEKLFEVLPECNELPECANDSDLPGEGNEGEA